MDEVLTPTPGQVAQNEAAKQAVVLVFGLVTAVIIMRLQRKMVHQLTQPPDVDAERTERMRFALKTEAVWNRIGAWASKAAVAAWRMGDKARAAYEADRA